MILPRQARNKHRENSEKEWRFESDQRHRVRPACGSALSPRCVSNFISALRLQYLCQFNFLGFVPSLSWQSVVCFHTENRTATRPLSCRAHERHAAESASGQADAYVTIMPFLRAQALAMRCKCLAIAPVWIYCVDASLAGAGSGWCLCGRPRRRSGRRPAGCGCWSRVRPTVTPTDCPCSTSARSSTVCSCGRQRMYRASTLRAGRRRWACGLPRAGGHSTSRAIITFIVNLFRSRFDTAGVLPRHAQDKRYCVFNDETAAVSTTTDTVRPLRWEEITL